MIFASNSQQSSKKVSSQQMLGFTYIEKITLALHTLQLMSRFVPYHSYSKIGKNMGTLGKLSIRQKTIFLCAITPKILMFNLI